MRVWSLITAAALLCGSYSLGQEPTFDVASVKPSVSEAAPLFQPRRNGSLSVINTPLRTIILRAYGLIVPTRADCSGNDPISEDDVRAKLLNGWPPCGMTTVVSTVDAADAMKRRVRRSAVTMDDFARELQSHVDRTGLEGRFDIEYTFVPSQATAET